MKYITEVCFSKNIVELFRNKQYEKYVLEIMNLSRSVFPGNYIKVTETGHGEPDYICEETQLVFDAKLPFKSKQVEMLTSGKKHPPLIEKWINETREEASHLNIESLRNHEYNVRDNKLYEIMLDKILGEKKNDENIIFFFPFLIGHCFDGFFIGDTSDCLDVIYESLKKEECLDYLANREVYAICPDALGVESFVLRNLSKRQRETVSYSGMSDYFIYRFL